MVMEFFNVIVDDRESNAPKTRRDNVEAELTHSRNNDSITSDRGTSSRGIMYGTEGDSSSDASTQVQATPWAIP